jgi:hypothetical protein
MWAAALAAGIVTVALKPVADGPTVIVLAAVVLVVSVPVVEGVGATCGVDDELLQPAAARAAITTMVQGTERNCMRAPL